MMTAGTFMNRTSLAFLLVLVTAGMAGADTRITSQERYRITIPGNERDTTAVHTLWLTDDRAARLDDQGRPTIISRLDQGEAYFFNHADRSYFVIELGTSGMAHGAIPTFERTGETRTIGAWTADGYHTVWEDGSGGVHEITVWMSGDAGLDLDAYRRYMAAVAEGQGVPFLQAMLELDGFPVLQQVEMEIGQVTTRVLSLDEEAPPPGIYDLPPGYSAR